MTGSNPEGGWIVLGRRLATVHRDEFAPGDKTEAYPILDAFDVFEDVDRQWTPGPHDTLFPHHAAQVAAGDAGPIADRVVAELRCECKGRRRGSVLARVHVRDARLWVWVRPQRFTRSQVDEHGVPDDRQPTYWPAHREPNNVAHTTLTTCPACKKHAAVLITETGAALHHLGRPVFGRVADDTPTQG